MEGETVNGIDIYRYKKNRKYIWWVICSIRNLNPQRKQKRKPRDVSAEAPTGSYISHMMELYFSGKPRQ